MSEDQGRHLTVVSVNMREQPKGGVVPDAEADGYVFPIARGEKPGESSVAVEAQALVYGDRQGEYGHPRENFTITAQLWTVVLQHKLSDGAYVTPEDVARCMRMVKEARQLHTPKRDNLVDIIGYAIAEDRLETGR